MKTIFALVDCNNFFVSCERVFRPDLEGRPVVVLSSNDGCAVARSNEAKALDIPMGAPAFKYRQLFKEQGVVQFSANFELYADISRRITHLLTQLTPQIEVYSIDESFLDLSQLPIDDYAAWGRALRQRILKEVGVPVSIGIAPTKTLAKLASEQAKHDDQWAGACDLYSLSDLESSRILANTPIEDLWGVGRQLAPRLKTAGIYNALSLSQMNDSAARQLVGSKHGAQLVAELKGTCCHPLETGHASQKSIMRGRTFGEDTNQFYVLEAAVANLANRAAWHLREEGNLALSGGLLLNTNRHKPGYRQWWLPLQFSMPTADSGEIISRLLAELGQHYQPRQAYHRANVFLSDFVPAAGFQTDLFGLTSLTDDARNQRRMQAVDVINRKYGKGRLHYASEDLSASWQPKHQLRSPGYVSQWDELPEAGIY